MSSKRTIELLSPAKNLECGLAAISHGADAVYIGGPKFGARETAGNSIQDIEHLASEAHLFGAKVYAALNTILYDEELEQARKIVNQLYEAGADALIIQDMGLLEMDLPPIPLHASTQVNNYDFKKIEFLDKVGFKRVVLARELSIDQIREIKYRTNIELEAFVHGALCVSFSGQCYLSHAVGGRSANRGACAQPCRKKYSLTDAEGNVLVKDKYLLSLKDMDRSASIEEMADAGITSFKIEGRLKDIGYVKNITSYYRKNIDTFLEKRTEFKAASDGKTYITFDPDPKKSFNRGSTEYFLHGRTKSITSFDTPKSLGVEIGVVSNVTREYFEIEGAVSLSNNDGLVFIDHSGESWGIRVNRIDKNRVYPDKMNGIFEGAVIFRNYDHEFRQKIKNNTAYRKIGVEFRLDEFPDGFSISALDETGLEVKEEFIVEKQPARKIERSREMILGQLAKTGETAFEVKNVETGGNEKYFFQASVLNEMRRVVLDKLAVYRKQKPVFTIGIIPTTFLYPEKNIGFEGNVSNHLARQFYIRHGVSNPGAAFEKRKNYKGLTVMTTKHCIKYQLGGCRRFDGAEAISFKEPLSLTDNSIKLSLEFDCLNCQMKLIFGD